jgi:hypothetical protein
MNCPSRTRESCRVDSASRPPPRPLGALAAIDGRLLFEPGTTGAAPFMAATGRVGEMMMRCEAMRNERRPTPCPGTCRPVCARGSASACGWVGRMGRVRRAAAGESARAGWTGERDRPDGRCRVRGEDEERMAPSAATAGRHRFLARSRPVPARVLEETELAAAEERWTIERLPWLTGRAGRRVPTRIFFRFEAPWAARGYVQRG